MSRSFNDSLTTLKDQARFELGLIDVSSDDSAVFSDELINSVLLKYGENLGMAKLCEQLAMRLDQEPIKLSQQLGMSVQLSENRSAELKRMAKGYRDGTLSLSGSGTISDARAGVISAVEVDTEFLNY